MKGLGGVYIGVGTDQNYLLAGWQMTELMFIMDFDPWVRHVHHIYRMAFLRSKTPGEFLKLWTNKGTAKMAHWIRGSNAPSALKKERIEVLRAAHWKIYSRLCFLRRRHVHRLGTFLDGPKKYNHLRMLHRTGRVIILRGNFVGRRTLQGIARQLRRHKRVVRALYLSNAEDYFSYRRVFRNAIKIMPVDTRSVILRAIYWHFKTGKIWAYAVQPAENFRRWMEDSRVLRLHQIIPRALVRRRPQVAIVFN